MLCAQLVGVRAAKTPFLHGHTNNCRRARARAALTSNIDEKLIDTCRRVQIQTHLQVGVCNSGCMYMYERVCACARACLRAHNGFRSRARRIALHRGKLAPGGELDCAWAIREFAWSPNVREHALALQLSLRCVLAFRVHVAFTAYLRAR